MKHKDFFVVILATLAQTGCRHGPNHAENIDTALESPTRVSGAQNVGVRGGDMVVQEKEDMSERLRDLQNAVYALEDRTYGTRKLGSLGLYGELRACRRKLASRAYGGPGTLTWTDPLDRVTDKEAELKVGLDENKTLVGVDREYLLERVRRFGGYKQILQKRFDEFTERVEACRAEAADRAFVAGASEKVTVRDEPKGPAGRMALGAYLCANAHVGASLRSLVVDALAKGWVSSGEYGLGQNLVAANLKDSKGAPRANVMVLGGWKLAFDKGPVTFADVLGGDPAKDARLEAWSFDRKAEVAGAAGCLKNADDQWNP